MKGDFKMLLITELDKIAEAQTIKQPSGEDVFLSFPHYSKGFITAQFNYKTNSWMYGYTETKDEALEHCETVKNICMACPDALNWFELSEIYLYSANGVNNINHHTRWSLFGAVVDD
jgi:hypothetical protein